MNKNLYNSTICKSACTYISHAKLVLKTNKIEKKLYKKKKHLKNKMHSSSAQKCYIK